MQDTQDDFPLLTPLTAIARREVHSDLFATGSDGQVHTNWWNSSWHN